MAGDICQRLLNDAERNVLEEFVEEFFSEFAMLKNDFDSRSLLKNSERWERAASKPKSSSTCGLKSEERWRTAPTGRQSRAQSLNDCVAARAVSRKFFAKEFGASDLLPHFIVQFHARNGGARSPVLHDSRGKLAKIDVGLFQFERSFRHALLQLAGPGFAVDRSFVRVLLRQTAARLHLRCHEEQGSARYI